MKKIQNFQSYYNMKCDFDDVKNTKGCKLSKIDALAKCQTNEGFIAYSASFKFQYNVKHLPHDVSEKSGPGPEVPLDLSVNVTGNLHCVIGILSAVASVFIALSAIFFRLYRKERNKRLTMWNVKSEDIRLEKIQWNGVETIKATPTAQKQTQDYKPLDVIDEKCQLSTKKAKHYYTSTGYYKGRMIAVQKYRARRLSLDKRSLLSDLDQIFKINHEHICKFYGSNQGGGYVTVLTEYCTRGSLQDLLNDQSDWDDVFKNSLIFDIVKGMLHVHQTDIGSHGNLKPSNCLIDSRFMVKITDFGIIGQRFKVKEKRPKINGVKHDSFQKKLWTAPELLRVVTPPQEGSKKGDVYSFAIIAQEILYQRGVFYRRDDALPAENIIQKLMALPCDETEAFRPTLQDDDDIVIHEQWRKTLTKCWAENPENRFDFQEIYQIAMGLQTENTLIDSLIQRLQKYSIRLEEKVEEKTEQYKAEKERSDSLLYQMLPQTVANRLKVNTDVMPESYSRVTVYFSDIVGFSAICHKSQPLEVVQMLNDLYTMFDQIIDEFDVYKVETIGDAYMVVSGLPIRNGNDHAREIARMAIRLRDSVCNDFVIRHMPNDTLRLRIGIHTGPVVAGVVGLKMPRYCLFGDTVNTAARMEQSGKELKIHISPHTKQILDQFETFNLKKRKHSVTLKGLGEWNTWWLLGERNSPSHFESIEEETTAPVVDIYVPSYNNRQPKQSVSSSVSSLSGAALITESSTESSTESAFETENVTNKLTFNKNTQIKDTKKGNGFVIPARYRPSCHANPSKQRRHGSAVTPLLVMPRRDNCKGAESLQFKAEQLGLMTPTDDYTTIGAIF